MNWRLNKDCNILTPSSSGYSSTSLSSCRAAQPGALKAQQRAGPVSHCFELQQLTPNSDLQLTRTSCSTRLYNCFTSTCFSERRNMHSIQPVHSQGYQLISSTGCTCYLHSCVSYLTAWPGRRSICYN